MIGGTTGGHEGEGVQEGKGWRHTGEQKGSLHAVMLLYLFLSSLSGSLLASDEYHGELLLIH